MDVKKAYILCMTLLVVGLIFRVASITDVKTANGQTVVEVGKGSTNLCKCANCLTEADVERIVEAKMASAEFAKPPRINHPPSPFNPPKPQPAPKPRPVRSADPLVGKVNADGSVTVAVSYDQPLQAAPRPATLSQPVRQAVRGAVRYSGEIITPVVQAGGQVVHKAAVGTCRVINGVRVCN